MKEQFKGYYNLSNSEFEELWDNAIFIFDTNVLLNLYRYQSSTRDSLLSVMEKLKDKIWIPYHVGLEFQRNRLTVIAEQHKRFVEVQSIIENSISTMMNEFNTLQLKNRHSHINPDKLIDDIRKLQSDFLTELTALEEKSINVNSEDEILDRLDKLFKDKVGNPPEKQEDIIKIFSEGENRYKFNIPPGYKDSGKDDKAPDEFTYGGITYKRKFGDLIIWKQIINHALKEKLKNIIFITDDAKADWWWKINSNGPKTIGVRPELKDEIYREGNVEKFHIYNPEGFLKYANNKLNVQITKETMEEVREVSDKIKGNMYRNETLRMVSQHAEKAVHEWLLKMFREVELNRIGFPDFITYRDNKKYGFEVKFLREPRILFNIIKDLSYKSYYMINEENFYEMNLVVILLDDESIYRATEIIERRMSNLEINLNIILGKPEYINEDGIIDGFIPVNQINLNDLTHSRSHQPSDNPLGLRVSLE